MDRIKIYNDDHGHPAGDECPRVVGRCLKTAPLRQGDVAARYGGEECAAILPNTDQDSAFVVAERVRKSLFELGLPDATSPIRPEILLRPNNRMTTIAMITIP